MARRRGDVDRTYPRVRQWRAQDTPVEHPRKHHIDGKASRPGDLRTCIVACDGFADHGKLLIWGKRRRLVGGNLTGHLLELLAHDAGWEAHSAGRFIDLRHALGPARTARVAATACGY